MSSTKIVLVSQARSKNQFRNLRSKVLKCCANIYFNHQYLKKNLTPNYPKIKMPSIITKQILLFLTETNNFIIVFQFDNTMECPLPKKKITINMLHILSRLQENYLKNVCR